MKHDERQKLKSNELVDAVENMGTWVKSHTRLLVSVAVLIVLGLGLWWFLAYQKQAGLERAWDALAKAKTADDFARVVRDYPNTPPVTAIALYRQGNLLEDQNSPDRAEAFYKRALDQPYNPLLTPLARLAMAHTVFAKGPSNFNDIRNNLTKIVTEDPKADAGVRLMAADDQRLLLAAEQWDLSAPSPSLQVESDMPPPPPTGDLTGWSPPATTRDDHK